MSQAREEENLIIVGHILAGDEICVKSVRNVNQLVGFMICLWGRYSIMRRQVVRQYFLETEIS